MERDVLMDKQKENKAKNLLEEKRKKAENLRYKKAIVDGLNLSDITDELYAISEECSNIRYFCSDDEMLMAALDGDEEEAYEFQMMFCDLSAECENLLDLLTNDVYITEHFDDFFVGINKNYKVLGYDYFMEDYFSMTSYCERLAESESNKRLMRLTKQELLSTAAQCFGIVCAFFNVRQKYDYLKASFDILENQNASVLQLIKEIEFAYERAEKAEFSAFYDAESVKQYEMLIKSLPDKVWLE